MSTPDKVRQVAQEFESLPDDEIQPYLDDASSFVDPTIFKAKSELATALVAAHFLKRSLAEENEGAGAIVGVSTDSLSHQWQQNPGGGMRGNEFSTTNYGAQFLRIRESLPPNWPIVAHE